MRQDYHTKPPAGSHESRYVHHVFSSESATEPVTRAELKAHLYIDTANTDFDALIDALIPRVRQYIEEITCVSLISRTVTFTVDHEDEFRLPYDGATVSVSSASIKTDIGEYEAQVAGEDYEYDGGRFISFIGPGYRWKIVYAVTVSVPQGLKDAVLNECARRFENRGDRVIVGNTSELIQPYKNLQWLV